MHSISTRCFTGILSLSSWTNDLPTNSICVIFYWRSSINKLDQSRATTCRLVLFWFVDLALSVQYAQSSQVSVNSVGKLWNAKVLILLKAKRYNHDFWGFCWDKIIIFRKLTKCLPNQNEWSQLDLTEFWVHYCSYLQCNSYVWYSCVYCMQTSEILNENAWQRGIWIETCNKEKM